VARITAPREGGRGSPRGGAGEGCKIQKRQNGNFLLSNSCGIRRLVIMSLLTTQGRRGSKVLVPCALPARSGVECTVRRLELGGGGGGQQKHQLISPQYLYLLRITELPKALFLIRNILTQIGSYTSL
jgi:hypothetical protein